MTNYLVYFNEIRQRFIKVLLLFLCCFVGLFFYSHWLFSYLVLPLVKVKAVHWVATRLTSPLVVPIQLALRVAMLVTMPYFLYQSWAFLCPALYRAERQTIWRFFILSLGFFYHYVALPMLLLLLTNISLPGVTLLPDISDYLSLSTSFYLIFGLIFETPLVMLFVVISDVGSPQSLVAFRPYFIVCAFVIGMVLTPPDVLSQLVLAIPLCLLYEIWLLICRFYKKQDFGDKACYQNE